MTDRFNRMSLLFSLRIALVMMTFTIALDANCAELTWVSEDQLADGFREMTIHIRLQPGSGEAIAALQFDLVQAGTLESLIVEIGLAAKEASKTITFNEIEPGRVRVIIAGLNRNTIGEGTVATLRYRVRETSVSKGVETLDRVILSDPFGTAVSVSIGMSNPVGTIPPEASNNSSSMPPIFAWAMTGAIATLLVGISITLMRPARRGKTS